MRKNLFLLLFIGTYLTAFTQPANREIVDQGISWMSTSSSLKFTKRFTLFLDGQYRFVSAPKAFKAFEPLQHQFRISGDFAINSKLSVTPIGYTYVWNYMYGKQPAGFINNEHRMYQQVVYKHSIKRFNFHHRFRTEERFIQDHDGITGEDLGFIRKQFRIRYRGMITVPLNKEKVEAGTLSAVVYDEVFMSWGHYSGGKKLTFREPDQNRIFVGLGYQINHDIGFSFGYFYQMLIKSNGEKQENNVGSLFMLTYNFDFSKKEMDAK